MTSENARGWESTGWPPMMSDNSTDSPNPAHGDHGAARAGTDTATPTTGTVEVDPQNPDPAVTAGLTEGGGVDPGDTPPVSSSVGGPHHEPLQRTRFKLFASLIG